MVAARSGYPTETLACRPAHFDFLTNRFQHLITMSVEFNKALVVRLVEAVNRSDLDVLDEVADGDIVQSARRWIGPFRESFPDFRMEIVDLVAEGDKVVAHLWCSGTHEGEWRSISPTGRRFERVNEIYIFHVLDGKLVGAVGVEDDLSRLRQLGVDPDEFLRRPT